MKEPEIDILKAFGLDNDASLQQALSEMQHFDIPAKRSKEESWSEFEQKLKMRAQPKSGSKVVSMRVLWLAAASIALILVASFAFSIWNNVCYLAENKQIKEIVLPDGSHVTLNAGSELKFKKWNWTSQRNINLQGEAFIKVIKGNEFKVFAGGNTVRVLGTEFNVLARENYFEVKCQSGRVEVKTVDNKKFILNKGCAVRKTPAKSAVEELVINPQEVGGWVNGQFYYQDVDVNLVFAEIERQFGVKVDCSIKNRFYSGYFNNSNLTNALNSVCLPMGLGFTINGKTVEIK